MSAQAQSRLTPEQYLAEERAAEFRHEYYNGHIYSMSGGSFQHGQIIGNLTLELGMGLKRRPCSVVPNDLRLRVSPTVFTPIPTSLSFAEIPSLQMISTIRS
jgi:Uma2 family endonuclease